IPGKGVYTSYKQFRSADGARLMKEYMEKLEDYNTTCATLNTYRQKYADGNRQIAYEIKRMENEKISLIEELKNLKNKVIKAES
ncbi:MAG: hypothetical protein K2F70_03440, partial [Muribaculaceae bacterium]|nr:hypothetical protein [Muribaculaceae bacterium]